MDKPKFYITTAIPYASSKPHFGNTYEVIMTDAYARYKRLGGYDVFFMTGTDEHGKKIEEAAAKAGVTPQQYADKITGQLRQVWDKMGASYDHFIRTTDDYHMKAVEAIFKKLYDQGDIYKSVYEGWYCTPDESFYTDSQLVDGKCPDCGREVTRAHEEAYFFKMSKYAPRLIQHIKDHPGFIQPESREKEMLNNFLLPGLQDLCVTRSTFKWGVPVPFDDKHVIYVWIDALTNYITGLGYNPDNEEQPELFRKYWPADVHIIGKDIVRFHTIYWPIILMALGLPLPEKVFGHPWFLFGQDKMSKSRGNIIYADELADIFGVDGVRWYALAEMPYGNDGSITYENVILRYNNDLANNLGNLVSRTVAMNKKYFGGVIQTPEDTGDETDAALKGKALEAVAAYRAQMDDYHIADACATVMDMLDAANKYIDLNAPWVLAKDEANKGRLGTVLYNLLETIRFAAVMITPAMPETAAKIFAQLGISGEGQDFGSLNEFGRLPSGIPNGEGQTLFMRIDGAKLLADLAAKKEAAEKEKEAAEKAAKAIEGLAKIEYDDFMKTELRTAQVIECEPVKRAKKLLKLTLDLGYEKRVVVSGIAQWYKPEDLIGKKIIVVANLKPATLCGVESNGMILASGEETVRVVFLDPETPLGERVR